MATLIAGMDPETKAKSLSFCGINDDQAFGTYRKYSVFALEMDTMTYEVYVAVYQPS